MDSSDCQKDILFSYNETTYIILVFADLAILHILNAVKDPWLMIGQ
jgi:hypothetical protein